MASNSQPPGDHDNQIPLQDLSRFEGPAEDRGRGRANSTGSSLFSRRSLIRGGSRKHYESVAEESPVELVGAIRNPFRPVRYGDRQSDEIPPEAIAQAMSFGATFDTSHGTRPTAGPSSMHDFNEGASDLDNIPLDAYTPHDHDGYIAPRVDDEDDTVGLTDPRYLQPISGAPRGEARRSSDTGSHFGHGARLGDDLPHLEEGLSRSRGSSARSRSLSPSASGGALQRASSMVKSMSQRVVNLSNEPEVIEQAVEREESHKNARLEGPPMLPAMPEYAHDPSPNAAGREKRLSWKMWRYRNNPFRGRSLGILGPDHPLRLWLCDVLVHPVMEPFILVVIIIQTILLVVESSKSVFDRPLAVRWGTTSLDYVFFVIFVIYTLEIIAKILVSGFVFNPQEYSTLNRSLGVREAIVEKSRNLITPHRQATTKKVSLDPQEPQGSILRTFTGMNGLDAGAGNYDDPLHKRRVRLAHRAFLRHSFNRLDFVAVVAFWVSFFLSLTGIESTHQLYIFRMLSCLRILRLLALTNGTSVSHLL